MMNLNGIFVICLKNVDSRDFEEDVGGMCVCGKFRIFMMLKKMF